MGSVQFSLEWESGADLGHFPTVAPTTKSSFWSSSFTIRDLDALLFCRIFTFRFFWATTLVFQIIPIEDVALDQ